MNADGSPAPAPDRPAKTVLMLHALGSSGRMWRAQVAALSGRYHVAAPDLPGHGRNPGRFTVDDAVEQVRGLLGGRPAYLVGTSLGASVALRLAQRHPAAVAGLLVSGATVRVARPAVALQQVLTAALPLAATAKISAAITRFADPADRDAWIADLRRAGKRTQLGALGELARLQLVPELGRITAPTLVCCGERDKANLASARLLSERIPAAAQPHVVPGGGHLWQLEQPDRCTKLIADFVG